MSVFTLPSASASGRTATRGTRPLRLGPRTLGLIRASVRLLIAQGRRPIHWWDHLEAADRVLYRAVGLLGVGCGLVWLPFLFIVPGILFALAFFSFRRA